MQPIWNPAMIQMTLFLLDEVIMIVSIETFLLLGIVKEKHLIIHFMDLTRIWIIFMLTKVPILSFRKISFKH